MIQIRLFVTWELEHEPNSQLFCGRILNIQKFANDLGLGESLLPSQGVC